MAGPPVTLRVEGLTHLVRVLEAAGADIEDMRDTFREIASAAEEVIRPYVPVRSGALRASLRSSGTKGRASARAGRSAVPYAPVVNWGRDGRSGQQYMQEADQHTDRWVRMLSAGIERALDRRGLTP